MGAVNFETTAWGRTPQEAFRSAVEHAQYMNGHGGYTGTIAEKGGFSLFVLPARVTAEKFLGWVSEADFNAVGYERDELRWAQESLASAKPGMKRAAQARVTAARKALAEAEKRAAKFQRALGAHANLVASAARVYDDKWGPAVAVEVTSPTERAKIAKYNPQPKRGYRLFVFAGMASS